ncbi:conserved domain-containing protein [Deinococcus reticulitermitis]|uniref:Conserved domain-containing protein n=1 Tax=Deinococcus reticulitermitis TaxID=856736 RepID=A0A1H6VGY5_9DEIO|nr:DUF2382 domain-containing protein [Deinococcus reticulitermitis]SEI99602.1 conserved domain-containing protein [Deinococcus reticulitermitis]
MTQASLIRLSDLSSDAQYNLNDIYNPVGATAYGSGGEKVGTVRDALVEPETGRIRYFLVDVGGWFSSKEVLVPVGYGRVDDSGVYFDSLTKDQVRDMSEYSAGQAYTADMMDTDERVLRGVQGVDTSTYRERVATGADTEVADYRRRAYQTPDRLQLLEERLVVNKDRFKAGSVQIGKRVETHQETVSVPLQREEVVIERHAVDGSRPVEGAVLGAESQTMTVDLEAERASVSKQAYVTEEVSVGKRAVTETQQVTETVGREVLEVNQTGEVRTTQGGTMQGTMDVNNRDGLRDGTLVDDAKQMGRDAKNAVQNVADDIDRKI